jgi:transposase
MLYSCCSLGAVYYLFTAYTERAFLQHSRLFKHPLRETLHKWDKKGLGGLWDASGRGGITKWEEEDIVYLEECLKNEPRTYNSRQLSRKLEKEKNIKLSPDRIRRVLKKRGFIGNEQELVTEKSKIL